MNWDVVRQLVGGVFLHRNHLLSLLTPPPYPSNQSFYAKMRNVAQLEETANATFWPTIWKMRNWFHNFTGRGRQANFWNDDEFLGRKTANLKRKFSQPTEKNTKTHRHTSVECVCACVSIRWQNAVWWKSAQVAKTCVQLLANLAQRFPYFPHKLFKFC